MVKPENISWRIRMSKKTASKSGKKVNKKSTGKNTVKSTGKRKVTKYSLKETDKSVLKTWFSLMTLGRMLDERAQLFKTKP